MKFYKILKVRTKGLTNITESDHLLVDKDVELSNLLSGYVRRGYLIRSIIPSGPGDASTG